MDSQGKGMKDVVAELRRESVAALLELFELDVALGEITLSAQSVSASLEEMAEQAQQLALTPGLVSPQRLEVLAAAAKVASSLASSQLAALTELKRELDRWAIAQTPS